MGTKLDYDYVKSIIESYGYILLSDGYVNVDTKLITLCPEGHIYEVSYDKFKQGRRCKYCVNKNLKYSIKDIREYVENEGYQLVDNDYKNCKEKLNLICPNNHAYQCSFDNFKRGRRCSHCKLKSKGEEKIAAFLNIYNINYIREYTFDDCKYIHKIPFDFYLNDLNILIEYDGIQHYEIVENWGGIDKFNNTREKDNIKK